MFALDKVEPSSTRHTQKLRARSRTIGQSDHTPEAYTLEPMPILRSEPHSLTRSSPNSKKFLGMPISSRITRSRPHNVPGEFIGITNDPNLLNRAGPSIGPRSSSINPDSVQSQSQIPSYTRNVNLHSSSNGREDANEASAEYLANSSVISSVNTIKPSKGKEVDLQAHLLEDTTRYLTLDGYVWSHHSKVFEN